MGLTAAIGLGTLIFGGSTVYQVASANSARADAKKQMQEQQARQDKLQQEAQDQMKKQQEEADNQAAVDANRKKMRTSPYGVGGGRSGTILTSPLGLPDTGTPSGGKTLLGA